ncbi:MAG: hypothetical protein J5I93_18090 [Pirellulaceae bacterium]|nr:hypothetical protein [Pirellulaceae bacterium]
MQPTPDEIARFHRWHAVESNNLAWKLSEQTSRTAAEDELMLDAAHASAYHWGQVGTELNQVRAQMLLGQVHAALGQGTTALNYARRSSEYFAARETPDWELAFAHAVLAHAASAAGDAALHQQHYALAEQLGQAIADPEDQAVFRQSFQRIPRP